MRLQNCLATLLTIATLPTSLAAQDGDNLQKAILPEKGWTTLRTDLEVRIDPEADRMIVTGTLRLLLDGADSSPGPSIVVNSRKRKMRFVSASADGAELCAPRRSTDVQRDCAYIVLNWLDRLFPTGRASQDDHL